MFGPQDFEKELDEAISCYEVLVKEPKYWEQTAKSALETMKWLVNEMKKAPSSEDRYLIPGMAMVMQNFYYRIRENTLTTHPR